MVDLQGNTLMPAFIDAHSHITALASTLSSVNLTDAQSLEEVARQVRAFVKERALPPVVGSRASGTTRIVCRSTVIPIRRCWTLPAQASLGGDPCLRAYGGDELLALRIAQIDRDTPDPAGRKIGQDADGTPNRYLEESAFTSRAAMVPPPGEAEQLELLDRSPAGLSAPWRTTVQDGLTRDPQWANLRQLAQQDRLLVDTVCYADLKDHQELYLAHRTGRPTASACAWADTRSFWMDRPRGAPHG